MNSSAVGTFRISDVDATAVTEFELDGDGNLTIAGDITTASGTSPFPDYVFEDDYDLMPMDELAAYIEQNNHLPNIPSASEVESAGRINMTEMQIKLLEKIEELTLYTLEQQDTISQLKSRLDTLENAQ